MYSFQGVKRNLKPMFGSASSGTKEKEYSSQSSLKRFKAYLLDEINGLKPQLMAKNHAS